MSVLENPVWAALSGPQACYAEASGDAACYQSDISPFAALADPADPAAWRDLAALTDEALLTGPSLTPGPGWETVMSLPGVQMIGQSMTGVVDPEAVPLGETDVPEILDLVERAKPGPFRKRTITLGRYLGIRVDGRLVAMAGERFRLPGWTEISAVATDPDFQGRGLGASCRSCTRRPTTTGRCGSTSAWASSRATTSSSRRSAASPDRGPARVGARLGGHAGVPGCLLAERAVRLGLRAAGVGVTVLQVADLLQDVGQLAAHPGEPVLLLGRQAAAVVVARQRRLLLLELLPALVEPVQLGLVLVLRDLLGLHASSLPRRRPDRNHPGRDGRHAHADAARQPRDRVGRVTAGPAWGRRPSRRRCRSKSVARCRRPCGR
jgi:hypothetical protein